MPSLILRSGVQDNDKATAVNSSSGGVAKDVTNNEGSPQKFAAQQTPLLSSRTSGNGFQNNGVCSKSSDIAITADTTANTNSSLHNISKDVSTNVNHLTTAKTTNINNNNNDGTPTFHDKLSANAQGNDNDDDDIIKSYVSSLVRGINNDSAVKDIIWKQLLQFPPDQFKEILGGVEDKNRLDDLALIIYGKNCYVSTYGGYAQGIDGSYDPVVELLSQFETSYKRDNGLIPVDEGLDDEEGEDMEEDCEEVEEDEFDGNDNGISSSLEGDVDFTNSGGVVYMDNANMNDENALDASQHQDDTAMEEVLSCVESNPSLDEMVGADELEESNEQEDFSILTVVQLKDRLRGLNLPLGGRKQELVDRLNDHLYPALAVEESDAAGADSDVDMSMDCVNDEEGNDVMDIDELVEAAIASSLDTAAIDAAVEACNNINAGGAGVTHQVLEKSVVGWSNVLDDATIVRKCSKLGLSELCHAIGSVSINVSVVFDIFRACTKLYDGGIKEEEFVVARSKLSGVEVIYCKSSRTGYIDDEELHLSDEGLQMTDEEDSTVVTHEHEVRVRVRVGRLSFGTLHFLIRLKQHPLPVSLIT